MAEYNHPARPPAEEAERRWYKVAQQEYELLSPRSDSQIVVYRRRNVERLKQTGPSGESLKGVAHLRAGDSGTLQNWRPVPRCAARGGPVHHRRYGARQIVQPGKLKAVIRIPETQAKDALASANPPARYAHREIV